MSETSSVEGFPSNKVHAAQRYLCMLKPWWSRFLNRMTVVPIDMPVPQDSKYGGIMSTDKKMNLYVDRNFALSSSVERIAGAIERELQHHVRDTWSRLSWLDEEERDRYLNICVSMEINSSLQSELAEMDSQHRTGREFTMARIRSMCQHSQLFTMKDYKMWGISGPPDVLDESWTPDLLELNEGLSAESYYRAIKNMNNQDPSDDTSDEGEDGGSDNGDSSSSPESAAENDTDIDSNPGSSEDDSEDNPEADQKPGDSDSSEDSNSDESSGDQDSSTDTEKDPGDDSDGDQSEQDQEAQSGSPGESGESGQKSDQDEKSNDGGDEDDANSDQEEGSEGEGSSEPGTPPDSHDQQQGSDGEQELGEGSESGSNSSSKPGSSDGGSPSSSASGSTEQSGDEQDASTADEKIDQLKASNSALDWGSREIGKDGEDPKWMPQEMKRADEDDLSSMITGQADTALRELAEDIAEASKDQLGIFHVGMKPSGAMSKWSDMVLTRSGINWKSKMRKVLSNTFLTAQIKGASDLSYSVRNPNQPRIGPVYMGLKGYAPKVYILQDVSGSMTAFMDRAMSSFKDIIRASMDTAGEPVVWITIDTEVIDVGRAVNMDKSLQNRMSYNYGGTNLDGTIEQLIRGKFSFKGKRYPKPDILIVSTDCMFRWPWRDKKKVPYGSTSIIVSSVKSYDSVDRFLPDWVQGGKNFLHVDI